MNKEEKEQWLYEAYQYTSNFDFNRLDKYEEANDDICIDDLILDYTMLYEFHKEEIKRLKRRLEEYQEYVEINHKEIERLNNIINKLEKDIKNLYTYGIKNNAEQKDYLLNRLQELKGSGSNE